MYVFLLALLIAGWGFMVAANYLDNVWQWCVAAIITFVLSFIAFWFEIVFLICVIMFGLLLLTAIFQFKKG